MSLPYVSTDVHENQGRQHRTSIAQALNECIKVRPPNDQTEAELAAGVTPLNYSYPPGDIRRYGAVGDNTTDDSAAIQRAINVMAVYGGEVFLPSPTGGGYSLGSTTLNVPSNVYLVGDANEMVKVSYAGTGFVVEFTGSSCGSRNLQFINTHVDGSGVRFAGPSQAAGMHNTKVEVTATPAANRTGSGIQFLSLDADNQFSSGFFGSQIYVVGYKTGHRYIGFNAGLETWTGVTFSQSFIAGPGAGVVSGISRGIWMDSKTNGVGTIYAGGTCEGFDVGITFEGGTSTVGFYFRGDLESNTTQYVIGATFCGEIEEHNAGNYIKTGANSTANRWFQERHLNGVLTEETYYGRQTMVYDHGGQAARWELFRGPEAASFISGTGLGVPKFAVQMDDSTDQKGTTNWLELADHKECWHTGAPTIGTWTQGDVIWNSNVAAAAPEGWRCLTSGTFSAATDNTGDTDGSTAVITGMTTTALFAINDIVTASAGFPAGPLYVRAKTASTLTLSKASTSVQSNITVATTDPTFSAMANHP